MNRCKSILVVVLGIVVIGIAGACTDGPRPTATPTATPRPTATPTPAPLVINVEDIYQAYQENEARANATYKGIKLNLHFNIDEIEDTYVIQSLGFLEEAQLRFDQEELIEFNIGDQATRICKLDGFDLDIWLKFDCR